MTSRTLAHVWSPQLRNRRRVDVYLPPTYNAGRERYPVVYMQDGQNLSDPDQAFAGTWELEAVIDDLAERGIEAIVVGVHHAGERRLAEYSPFPDRRHGGGDGDAYLDFLITPAPPISLYALLQRGAVFGGAGVMSAALWYGQGRIFDVVTTASPAGRVYVDVGMHEGAGTLRNARRLARLLTRRGWRRKNGLLRYVEDGRGRHSEADWARRLPGALEFLLQ